MVFKTYTEKLAEELYRLYSLLYEVCVEVRRVEVNRPIFYAN